MDEKPKITGYPQLNDEELALINEIKAKAEEVGALVDRLKRHDLVTPRWISIGQTDLQTGFMALVRSVAKPETF